MPHILYIFFIDTQLIVWPSNGVLSLSPTGPDLPTGQAGAGRGDECVASIDPIDVSNRDEVGVGDILTSTSPAERG